MNVCCEKLGGSIYDSLTDEFGNDQLLNYQKEQKKKGIKLRQIMIILDDYADSDVFNKRNSSVASIFYRGRHAGSSVICTIQYYRRLPKDIRSLSHYKMLFRPIDSIELAEIAEENHLWLHKNEFIELMNKVTSVPYNFLMIDSKNMKMSKIFETVVSEFKNHKK